VIANHSAYNGQRNIFELGQYLSRIGDICPHDAGAGQEVPFDENHDAIRRVSQRRVVGSHP
jgi:hypothetical protein